MTHVTECVCVESSGYDVGHLYTILYQDNLIEIKRKMVMGLSASYVGLLYVDNG